MINTMVVVLFLHPRNLTHVTELTSTISGRPSHTQALFWGVRGYSRLRYHRPLCSYLPLPMFIIQAQVLYSNMNLNSNSQSMQVVQYTELGTGALREWDPGGYNIRGRGRKKEVPCLLCVLMVDRRYAVTDNVWLSRKQGKDNRQEQDNMISGWSEGAHPCSLNSMWWKCGAGQEYVR